MSIEHSELLKNYVTAMHEGDAALFIGAGMSRPAGFVDWRGLLRNCAKLSNDQLLDAVFEIIERVSDITPPKPVKNQRQKPDNNERNREFLVALSIAVKTPHIKQNRTKGQK